MFDSQYLLDKTGTLSGEMRGLVWPGTKENVFKNSTDNKNICLIDFGISKRLI